MQLNIKRVRKAEAGEYHPSDYLPVSDRDPDEMYQELMKLLEQVKNPFLQHLINKYFKD